LTNKSVTFALPNTHDEKEEGTENIFCAFFIGESVGIFLLSS